MLTNKFCETIFETYHNNTLETFQGIDFYLIINIFHFFLFRHKEDSRDFAISNFFEQLVRQLLPVSGPADLD